MTMIVDRNNFQLRLTTGPSAGDLTSVELEQCWPEAQRPHWRRVCQLNLTQEELGRLSAALRPKE